MVYTALHKRADNDFLGVSHGMTLYCRVLVLHDRDTAGTQQHFSGKTISERRCSLTEELRDNIVGKPPFAFYVIIRGIPTPLSCSHIFNQESVLWGKCRASLEVRSQNEKNRLNPAILLVYRLYTALAHGVFALRAASAFFCLNRLLGEDAPYWKGFYHVSSSVARVSYQDLFCCCRCCCYCC